MPQSAANHIEQRLRDAYAKHGRFVYRPDGRRGAPQRPVIHAALIHPGELSTLELAGTRVTGSLDLRFAKIDYPLRFVGCTFDGPVDLREAELRSLSFERCTVPEILASHVRVTGDVNFEKAHVHAGLSLSGAHLGDDLRLDWAQIGRPGRHGKDPVLDLANIEVGGDVHAEALVVHGRMRTAGARIGGRLPLKDARLTVPRAELAWDGDRMQVGGDIRADRAQITGRVSLKDARLLNAVFTGATITGGVNALVLDRMQCQGSFFCERAEVQGCVQVRAALITSGVYLNGSHLTCAASAGTATAAGPDAGRAINLNRTRLGDLDGQDGLRCNGEFYLVASRVGGVIELSGATLAAASETGPAFTADRCSVGTDLRLEAGAAVRGGVSLTDAHIGCDFLLGTDGREATVGPALDASGLTVGRDAELHTAGTVCLRGAQITGDLRVDLEYLTTAGEERPAADLSAVQARVLTLDDHQRNGVLDLSRAQVTLLRDAPDSRDPVKPIVLDGLEYGDLAMRDESDVEYRLRWLAAGSTLRQAGDERTSEGRPYRNVDFVPQPYTQLATVYQRAGRDHDARKVLCNLHRERNRRAVPWWPKFHSKAWNYLQYWFLGYGYAPVRALGWVLVLAGLSSTWLWVNDLNPAQAAILSLALVLPGSGLDQLETWQDHELGVWSEALGAGLVICGLLLGATVIAAIARVTKR